MKGFINLMWKCIRDFLFWNLLKQIAPYVVHPILNKTVNQMLEESKPDK